MIQSASLKVTGAVGPSGLNAHECRRLCTSHKSESRDVCCLCSQKLSVVSVARRTCSFYVDPSTIAPLLTCHQINTEQAPRSQTKWKRDTAHRIIAKSVLMTLGSDIQDATSCIQLCGGQFFGLEAAINPIRSAFRPFSTTIRIEANPKSV